MTSEFVDIGLKIKSLRPSNEEPQISDEMHLNMPIKFQKIEGEWVVTIRTKSRENIRNPQSSYQHGEVSKTSDMHDSKEYYLSDDVNAQMKNPTVCPSSENKFCSDHNDFHFEIHVTPIQLTSKDDPQNRSVTKGFRDLLFFHSSISECLLQNGSIDGVYKEVADELLLSGRVLRRLLEFHLENNRKEEVLDSVCESTIFLFEKLFPYIDCFLTDLYFLFMY